MIKWVWIWGVHGHAMLGGVGHGSVGGSAPLCLHLAVTPSARPVFMLITILRAGYGVYRDILYPFGQLYLDRHFEIGLNNARNGVRRKCSISVQFLPTVYERCLYTRM